MLVKSIKNKCLQFGKDSELLQFQVTGQLPQERLKPAPTWSFTSLDFFGPFEITREINKRPRGKGYGALLTCTECTKKSFPLLNESNSRYIYSLEIWFIYF